MKSVFLFLVLLVSVLAGAEDRAAADPGPKKTAEKGGVNVSVIPLNLGAGGAASIDFQLVMDTHAGALPTDMIAFAKLVGEGGVETPPFAWTGGRGGHHLSGTLSFPSVVRKEGGSLSLTLKKVDGRNDIHFEWRVPSKSAHNVTGGA